MSQEPSYNKKEKNSSPRFGNRPPGEDPNQAPKKGPKFSIYWVYAIIFAVLIGFQLFGPFSPNLTSIDQEKFEAMMRNGEVKHYTVISNKNVVRVTLTKDAAQTRAHELKKGTSGKVRETGPHMYFKIVSGDSF